MTTKRRSVMWPLIVIAVGGVWLLVVADVLPEAVADLMARVWPALLILFGFDVLLGRQRLSLGRFTVGMNAIGLVLTAGLVVVLVRLAYDKQADVVRDDNVQTLTETLPDDITQVQVNISVERTKVTVSAAGDNPRDLRAEFKGSKGSEVEINWSVEGSAGVLVVTESLSGTVPKLEEYGRGTLDVVLPPGVTIQQFTLTVGDGDVTVDMQPLQVEQVEMALDSGNLSIELPAEAVLTGTLEAHDGGIELSVPEDMALTLNLAQGSGEPAYEYDSFLYDLLRNGTLKRKNTDAFQIGLTVWLKDGAPLVINDLD
ncbi:MAG: DUF4097 family beta strand repeat protein [Anaerolineae bacterium]|jgi:hypothetical protein|nr:DUF4097 family beta strand repeat protein [Anaerolineae bacterium]